MKFDVYNRFQLEIIRGGDAWAVYRLGLGTWVKTDLVIPSSASEDELATYLDDIYHEMGRPGLEIRVLK
jgi:hypothetical protein